MKILIVSLSNIGGGASIAVDRLATLLAKRGYDVEVLVFYGKHSDYYETSFVYSRKKYLIFRIKLEISRLLMGLFRNPSHDYRSVNLFPSRLLKVLNQSDADVINFHWIGAEMLSIEQIAKISKPIVWTLHDAWMVNGVYHVSPLDYFPYQKISGNNWLDKMVYARKKKAFRKKPMHFISPSTWIAKRFLTGALFKPGDSCTIIRNIIDTNIWRPIDKNQAKTTLGFSSEKTNILFIANNIIKSYNKGFVFVKKLLNRCSDEYVFHFVGSDDEIELDRVVMHGRITNQQELVLFYSASDVCILPSLSENMSNVSVESLLCNTPVLCFDTTGLSEIIKTGINGYKAKKFDIDDLYKGLEYLRSFNPSVPLAETIPDFNPDICLKKYVDVYEKVIEKGK